MSKNGGGKNDGGYIVPVKACKEADVLLGYGIAEDTVFEEAFSTIYNKPSYSFDCGVKNVIGKNSLFHFIDECIGSDKFLWQESSGKITSFSQQIKNLGLENKKLLIKMDIEGAEYDAIEGMQQYFPYITGMLIEIHFHFNKEETTKKALKLLKNLSQHFVLLHVHGCNFYEGPSINTSNVIGNLPRVIELTYINKSLVTNYHLSKDQSHPTPLDSPDNPLKPDCKFEIIP
ncbi:MAG: FkbM family methyltransferase [Rickettsia endosymbiont of Argas persicus]